MVLECEASPSNFSQAKKIAGEVFAQHPLTIYCGCEFNGKNIDLASCGMNQAQENKRAHRVEWEHILRRFSNML
jgi:deoxyribonuclease-1